MSDQFDWVEFYKELAWKLLPYKDNRQELIRLVRQIYDMTGISMPTLERDNKIVDIDPFTFYGLFNKSSMKEINRIKILSTVAKLFDISSPVPSSFSSIPVLNNQNATFYYFVGERGEEDIDDLWWLFQRAMSYVAGDDTNTNTKMLVYYFDRVIKRKGNGNSKITMGLYWIAPDTFLNLDQRNTWYIYESGKIPEEVVKSLPPIEPKIPADKYMEIIYKMRVYLESERSTLKNFKELSAEAWRYSEEVNQLEKMEKEKKQKQEMGNGLADSDVRTTHYWLYSPGVSAVQWDEFYLAGIMSIDWNGPAGDLSVYKSREEIRNKLQEQYGIDRSYKNDSLALWQFANVMQPGDIVYAKKGMHKIVGRGVVESDYEYGDSDEQYHNIRNVKWTHRGEWDYPGQAAQKVLTDITQYTDTITKLEEAFKEENGFISDPETEEELAQKYPLYDEKQFLSDVFMDKASYDTLVNLLRKKKNVILQGAPGVGKTYAAKRLAYSMMGEKNQDRVMMVQFHQSYSYEDFIEGFRPTGSGNGFEIKKGSFYHFCRKAAEDPENEYFFIIDEINRGNLSRIFGELFMLIENDKRGNELQLLYSDEKFDVPRNVYILGMMNTADRSLAMLDYALRRRFAFYDMKPAFGSSGFREYRANLNSDKFNRLIDCVERLNNAIKEDESLGEGFCIGHSYFCNLEEVTDRVLSDIVEYELNPLLQEYWYDDRVKANDWIDRLRDAIR